MSEKLNDGFRVITQEETPLYRARVMWPNFLPSEFKLAAVVILDRAAVPMYDGSIVVGTAHIYIDTEDQVIKANLVFDYHTPERLDMDLDVKVYATPHGSFGFDQNGMVDSIRIDSVILSYRPVDETSYPIGRA